MELFDAREKINVLANQVVGKGGEKANVYVNCNISYNNVPNMPKIQSQFSKITDHISKFFNKEIASSSFYTVIGNSQWLKSLSLLLSMGYRMASCLKKGKSVFVHCSDGWDRTAQASALCQILVDSYYRTLEGFMVLIEKEFSQTGHMLEKRLGVFSHDSHNRSPIFLQFLDAVHNLIFHNPKSFQFNQFFLRDLALVAYFGVFSNFLKNEERERVKLNLRAKGLHSFDFFNIHKAKYVNSDFGINNNLNKNSSTKPQNLPT